MVCSCVCVWDLCALASCCCQSIVSRPCRSFSHVLAPGSGVGDLINRSAMAGGEKRVELIAGGCESKGVCALFGHHACEFFHCFRVEDVDDARVTNRYVEAIV